MQNPSRHVACRRTWLRRDALAPLRARHRRLRQRGTAGRGQHARRRTRRTCGRERAAGQLRRVLPRGGGGACCAARALCGSCGSPHRKPATHESARIAACVHSASARAKELVACSVATYCASGTRKLRALSPMRAPAARAEQHEPSAGEKCADAAGAVAVWPARAPSPYNATLRRCKHARASSCPPTGQRPRVQQLHAQLQPSVAAGKGCARWERTWQKRLGTPSTTVHDAR